MSVRDAAVAGGAGAPDPDGPEDVDPWAEVALLARIVDRQLEDVRSTYGATEGADGLDSIGLHVRRSATEVAERCARMAARPNVDAAAGETARRLASMSTLAVLAMPTAGVGGQAGVEGATDVVVVLGDAVAERFRSLVHAVTEGSSPWPPPHFSVPVELFIRQLPEHAPTMSAWRLATIWVAMALKIAEAAMWWNAAPTDDPRVGRGAPG
jgi:hypothetical protein